MKKQSLLIYLTGKPGTGKYTIAKELELQGFVVCDNQLINNPIFELLKYDGFSEISQLAWDYIGKIRNIIFDFISKDQNNDYVLTNNLYEDEGDRNLYEQVKEIAKNRDSLFIPVRLMVSEAEHLKRITQATRKHRLKSVDPKDIYSVKPLLSINHANFLELEVSNLSAKEVAEIILQHALKLN